MMVLSISSRSKAHGATSDHGGEESRRSESTVALRRRIRGRCTLALWLAIVTVAGAGHAQTLPPGTLDRIEGFIGNRVETLVILGGDNGLTGGAYVFSGGANVEIGITKVGGRGTLGDPRPLGVGQLAWAPILEGNFGYVTTTNYFISTPLAGNTSEYETFGAEVGGGVRLFLNDHASIGPRIALIYGRTSNTFWAATAPGAAVLQAFGGGLVNWTLNSFTVVPAVDLQVDWTLGPVVFQFVSDYRPFLTRSFGETSPLISLNGFSQAWTNSIDVDIPLGVSIWNHELHTGGFFNRASLFGDLSRALRAGAINTGNVRLVADVGGWVPRMKWIGVGGSYYWGTSFDGYSIGVDVRTEF